MAETIALPKVGLTMEDGRVAGWFVAVGDTDEAGQAIDDLPLGVAPAGGGGDGAGDGRETGEVVAPADVQRATAGGTS